MMRLVLFVTFLWLSWAQASVLPDVLVTPTWLQQHLEQVTVIGVYKKLKAEQLGIYTAQAVDFSKLRGKSQEDGRALDSMRVNAETFTALMQALGVNQDSVVVISYAGQNSDQFTMATRLYWTLKYYGLKQVAIVNGGDQSWQQAGFPVATMATQAKQAGNFQAQLTHPDWETNSASIYQAISENEGLQLVDARTLDYYLGLHQKSYVDSPGHIPGAKVFPHPLMMDPKNPGALADRDTLRQLISAFGIDPEQKTATYCNSGHLGSGAWFVLHEVLQQPAVALYDGSMHAWTKHPKHTTTVMQME